MVIINSALVLNRKANAFLFLTMLIQIVVANLQNVLS